MLVDLFQSIGIKCLGTLYVVLDIWDLKTLFIFLWYLLGTLISESSVNIYNPNSHLINTRNIIDSVHCRATQMMENANSTNTANMRQYTYIESSKHPPAFPSHRVRAEFRKRRRYDGGLRARFKSNDTRPMHIQYK